SMLVGGVETQVLNQAARALNIARHAAHNGIASLQSLRDLELALDQLPQDLWLESAVLAERLAAGSSFAAGLRLLPQGTALAGRLALPIHGSVQVRLRAMSAPPLALGFDALTAKPGLAAKLRYVGEN